LADVVRLDKGRSEGLESGVVEEIMRLMLHELLTHDTRWSYPGNSDSLAGLMDLAAR